MPNILPEHYKRSDIIPPEGYRRLELDRPMLSLNGLVAEHMGPEKTPMQTAIDRARSLGRVSLLDIGCGTGHALYGLQQAVHKQAPCPLDSVPATGISLYDYSRQSLSHRTRDAFAAGPQTTNLTYRIGDALKILPDMPKQSVDVVLAFYSLTHSRRQREWFQAIGRVMRPGGVLFFNLQGAESDHPLLEHLYPLEDAGWQMDLQIYEGVNPLTETTMACSLCRVTWPDQV